MGDQEHSREPGWYEIDGEERYWNGHGWGVGGMHPPTLKRVGRPVNSKLSTLGGLAVGLLAIGVVLALFAFGYPNFAYFAGAFIGLAFSTWLLWLAVGAVVDAIDRQVQKP